MTETVNSTQSADDRQRVTFLDNLRYLFVFGVVVQHASMAYVNSDWWPVVNGKSILAEYFLSFADSFLMPSLFLVSGYFAIPSMGKRGPVKFIKGKLRRLGLPWIVIILTICPVLPLIHHYTRDGLKITVSYWETWKSVMWNALQFDFGVMPPQSVVMQNDLFYQRYMWFLGLLMMFFLLFALIYRFKAAWFESDAAAIVREDAGVGSTLKLLGGIGLITTIGSMLLISIFMILGSGAGIEPWFTVGNLVQFRVSRVFLHGVYFIIGILAYKWKWVERGRFPGHLKTWSVSLVVILILFFVMRFFMLHGPDEFEIISGFLFWVSLNFLAITNFGFFASLTHQFMNRPSRINKNLAANSYNMYLSHYIFVQIFQLALVFMPAVPPSLKFIIVSAASIGFGYLASQFLIRPYPKLTAAILFALTLVMFLLIQP